MTAKRDCCIIFFALLACSVWVAPLLADPVTGWQIDTSFGGGPTAALSGAATNSPIVGNGTPENARNVAIWAAIPQTQLNDGQTIQLSGEIEPFGFSDTPVIHFRWGLFRETSPGAPDPTSGWNGFLVGGDANGQLWEKHPAPPRTFASFFDSVEVADGSVTNSGGVHSGNNFAFELLITRDGDAIDIVASLEGVEGSTFAIGSTASDYTSLPELDFTFNRVGFLSAMSWSASELRFYDVDVTVVPEPSAARLLGVALFLVLAACRSKNPLAALSPSRNP